MANTWIKADYAALWDQDDVSPETFERLSHFKLFMLTRRVAHVLNITAGFRNKPEEIAEAMRPALVAHDERLADAEVGAIQFSLERQAWLLHVVHPMFPSVQVLESVEPTVLRDNRPETIEKLYAEKVPKMIDRLKEPDMARAISQWYDYMAKLVAKPVGVVEEIATDGACVVRPDDMASKVQQWATMDVATSSIAHEETEPERECTCPTQTLMTSGCQCGATDETVIRGGCRSGKTISGQ